MWLDWRDLHEALSRGSSSHCITVHMKGPQARSTNQRPAMRACGWTDVEPGQSISVCSVVEMDALYLVLQATESYASMCDVCFPCCEMGMDVMD